MDQTKRLGLSVGLGLGAGLMALIFGVFGALMILIDSVLLIVVLRYLFPGAASQIADRVHCYLTH